jgi:hypothetical protein
MNQRQETPFPKRISLFLGDARQGLMNLLDSGPRSSMYGRPAFDRNRKRHHSYP